MKKLILTGKQCTLLFLKVEASGYGFYQNITDFLEENMNIPEGETAELEIEDDDEFEDVISMVNGYLTKGSNKKDLVPTEQEIVELKELINQLNSDQPVETEPAEEELNENTTGAEEEK